MGSSGINARVHGDLSFGSWKLYFVLLMKSHLQSYPCPLQINFFWNLGFFLGVAIIIQIITGIFLALHYTSDLNSAYFSLFFLIREVYYGWCLRYFHSSGASFVFLFHILHLGRAMFYGSNFYNPNTWFSGILLFLLLTAIAFVGYVLPFGQMSFWGATVITNLLSPFPSLVEWVCGEYCVHNPTLKRFFLFHFQLPFLLCGFVVLHLFYLHFLSSNNPLRNSTNNKIPFFPFILQKDYFGLVLILCLYFLQTHFHISSFSLVTSYKGFGNYLLVIFQGSPEVVYPRVNNLSILILFLSYLLLILSLISEFGGGTGWTLYPPLSTSFMSLSPSSTGNLIFGLLMSGISSCLTSLNFWTTILNLRSYCLTLKTMPLFPWALLITAAMLLLTLPVLSGALLMVLADLHSNTLFFDPIFGGDPILYQHLFWFFGHPEVYILIIPAFGVISIIISSSYQKMVFGNQSMIFAMSCISLLGTLAWGHHMYTVGLETDA